MTHGGKRQGAGRKPDAHRELLKEKLSPFDESVFNKLIEGIEKGDYRLIKLFFEYRFGKPTPIENSTDTEEKQTVTINYISPRD